MNPIRSAKLSHLTSFVSDEPNQVALLDFLLTQLPEVLTSLDLFMRIIASPDLTAGSRRRALARTDRNIVASLTSPLSTYIGHLGLTSVESRVRLDMLKELEFNFTLS